MIYSFKKCLYTLAILVSFLASACDDPNTVGLDVLPTSDLLEVQVTDTLTMYTYTVREDSLTTTNTSASLCGNYTDPVFGYSRASFFAQLAPLKNNPDFGVEPKADSVFLFLAYSGSYGDTLVNETEQIFDVFQVTQDLLKDTIYYSNTPIAYQSLIGSQQFLHSKDDTILKIKLDTAFFRTYILNQSGQTTLGSVTAFQDYFKGIYVTPSMKSKPDKRGSRIYYFNLSSSLTRLQLHYHNAVDTGIYDLQIDAANSCVTVNHFEHNYVGTPIAAQLLDTITNASTVYLQSMAGVKTKIKMPFLKNFNNIGRIAINKAELVISNDPSGLMGYYPASQIAVQGIDSTGASSFTPDYFESLAYRGGEYDKTTGVYKTNITRYVQQVLTGKSDDNGIYLVVYGGSVYANRSILQGNGPLSTNKIKLQITYSRLN